MSGTDVKEDEKHELDEVITQISAFSSGTREKFIIIDELMDGKKAASEIHKKLDDVRKSTLYKYIADLEDGKIIKKDVMDGKGVYSLAGFSIVLTPRRISEMLEGIKEGEDEFAKILKFDRKINIVDRYNRPDMFYPGVLLSDMLYCGIKLSTGVDIIRDVMENLQEGISTREISAITRRMIAKRSKSLANDYKKYIVGVVNVETDDGIKQWDDEKIEMVIKERHNVLDIPAPELEYISHKVGRRLKRLGKVIPENLAFAYMDYMVSSYSTSR